MTDFILTVKQNIEDGNITIDGFAGNLSEIGWPMKFEIFYHNQS